MSTTKIEWARNADGTRGETWNPLAGCTRVSPGCDHCYAAVMSARLEAMGQAKYAGLTVLNGKGERHFNGKIRLDHEALTIPLRRRKPTTYFVNSMSDLFHDGVPDEFIHDVLLVCGACGSGGGWHTFQILTKRAKRAADVLCKLNDEDARNYAFNRAFTRVSKLVNPLDKTWLAEYANGLYWPLPNVWFGVSAEDQKRFDERVPHLLRCPTAVRFLSLEPLLGEIDAIPLDGISWCIVGGESGPGARPMHPDWARSIRDQCVAAGVPFFFKQWGAWTPGENVVRATGTIETARWFDKQWLLGQENLACEDGHADDQPDLFRVGKKAAGRVLDGRTWDEMPSAVTDA